MTPDDVLEPAFIPLIQQNGLDGKLGEQEIASLFGVCQEEVVSELTSAAEFLKRSPEQESVIGFYKTERAKDPGQVMAQVDTGRSSIDIGDLRGIRFTPAMWEVVKGCRAAAHFAKLDAVANYHVSKWGNPADGLFSIDAQVNKPSPGRTGKSGCALFVGLLVLGGTGSSILLLL